jgi:ferric-dicitrate binding protein FerR (iron transport regulator)
LTVTISTALPSQIQQLLEQRAQHSAALTAIEATLAKVTAALGGSMPAASKSVAAKASPATSPAAATKRKAGRPKAGATGMTANEFVLGFVKAHKNPTSQEISKAWKDSARNGTCDNALSVLTKTGKLKREALGVGIRGSRYMVA